MSTILITGATGKQGSSLIQSLTQKKSPFQLLAVTRNTQSPSAQKLVQKFPNVKLIQGDLDNPGELFERAQVLSSAPISGVFSVQLAIGNTSSEESQGKNLIDEALKYGVKHFVYSSADRGGAKSINNPTDIPHFINKHHIEKHLLEKTKNGEMGWTILRPVAFYENLSSNFFGKVFATSFRMSLKGAPLQMIGVSDIGTIAAEVFLNPEKYKGQAMSLAGDELTYSQFETIFKEKTGKSIPTTFQFLCAAFMAMVKDMGFMFRWFHDEGFGASIEEVRKIHPNLKDFGTWLETESDFARR
ncbi:uncharacterized protein N7469_007555 [Penicillium citrinum]|uniref:NmrA-like domain-containing protein n=1 Tax=Penicillium citrinum TaxID=5077 RepID=A0A9W9NWP3_PENCI|nr:uncharacterized protein N7469_007555 [Penicillium citrinum]KAJ5227549.1 hypothetical protein N7469_007555 [Penicillium citrinum]